MVKTTIKYSKIYNFCFLRDENKDELEHQWQLVQDYGKMFEPVHKKNITKILELIPKYTGIEWTKYADEVIPIYIMSVRGPSFYQPLTLRIRKDPLMMLSVLIHELVHTNCPPDQFKDHLESENCVNEITFRIIEDLKIPLEKYEKMLTSFTEARFGNSYKKGTYDARKQNLADYLKKAKK